MTCRPRGPGAIVRPMIVTFTDFGVAGPYLGQMRAVLNRLAPAVPVVDLFADAPAFDAQASAYLLAAYARAFEDGDVFLCVVDPGVGGARAPLALDADGRWYVGPDNGLLAIVARRAAACRAWEITWRPEGLSASFHGRDLFAPVAANLAGGASPPGQPCAVPEADWPDDLARVVYVDGYGNVMTGLRDDGLAPECVLRVGAHRLARARTFARWPRARPSGTKTPTAWRRSRSTARGPTGPWA